MFVLSEPYNLRQPICLKAGLIPYLTLSSPFRHMKLLFLYH